MLIVEGEGEIRALNVTEPGAQQTGPAAEVSVFISDAALRWLTLPWNEDLLRDRSALQQLDLHAELMFGKEPDGLVYARAYAPFGQPQCAAGLPKRLLEAIHAFARDRNLTVTSLQPLAWVCWEQCRKAVSETNYLFAVIERSAVSALVISNRRVERVVSRGCLDDPVAALAAMWHRMQLREPQLAEITALYAFDATGEMTEQAEAAGFKLLGESASTLLASASSPRGTVDFMPGTPPMSGWRSALLAAGIACLAVFGAGAALAYSEHASLREDMDVASSESLPRPVRNQQGARAQIRSVNQAITALNLPVGALLRSIQPPRELHTALLGLDLSDIRSDTHTATVKITAESRTGADMTAYVDRLSRSRMFESVFLTRHEIADAGGEHSYRYEVQVAWRQ